jgi:hypothetical protein
MTFPRTAEFTVKDARNAGTKPNPHGGTLVKWYCDLLDEAGEPVKDSSGKVSDAYWQRKEGSDVVPGDVVYGTISEGDFGLRFKMEKRPDGHEVKTGSAGSQNTGGKKDWEPESERDPERAARILRQHSQGLAVQVLTAMGSFEGKDALTLHRWLKEWTDYFDEDANKAGQAAKQASGIAAPQGKEGAAPSLASASPASVSQPADPSLTEIEQALDAAGLFGPPASQVASYMLTQFNAEQQVNAVRKLTGSDLEAQSSALDSLKTLTEKWSGKPLPVADPADSIPF